MPDDMLETFKAQGVTEGSPQHKSLARIRDKVANAGRANNYPTAEIDMLVESITHAVIGHVDELVEIDTERDTEIAGRMESHLDGLSEAGSEGLHLFATSKAREIYGDATTGDHIAQQKFMILCQNGSICTADVTADHRMKEEVILRGAVISLPDNRRRAMASIILDEMYPQE